MILTYAKGGGCYIACNDLVRYKTVTNSAMFEHVLTRKYLDKVNKLVDEDGCLIVHTVVCKNIPKDSDWFYLTLPVHTAFHTNKSMQLLMEQWGYESSVYAPKAKCWVLSKKNGKGIKEKISNINGYLKTDWFVYKKGFVDYWKWFS